MKAIVDPEGGNRSFRVIRGGGWDLHGFSCRASDRDWYFPTFRFYFLGFRLIIPGDAVKTIVDPEGGSGDLFRVIRGGSRSGIADDYQSSESDGVGSTARSPSLGGRLVMPGDVVKAIVDPENSNGLNPAIRGGCWYSSTWGCQVDSRNNYDREGSSIGLRLTLSCESTPMSPTNSELSGILSDLSTDWQFASSVWADYHDDMRDRKSVV